MGNKVDKRRYEIANNAGKDAADRRMRKQGRTFWNRGDYNLYCRTFDKIYPEWIKTIKGGL
jgi:hypothetical protein